MKKCRRCQQEKGPSEFQPNRRICKACEHIRRCIRCGVRKPEQEFQGRKEGRCKSCYNQQGRERWKQDAEWKKKKLAISRKYYGKHRAKIKVQMKELNLRRYGLNLSTYTQLSQSQRGLCALCGGPPQELGLMVDHDHLTGQVRGLLCNACNLALGLFQDQPWLLDAAAAYLRRHAEAYLHTAA